MKQPELWQTHSQRPSKLAVHHWDILQYRGSLTKKLRQLTHNTIQLRVALNDWNEIHTEESKFLQLSKDTQCWVREIEWVYQNNTWIHARVVIPETTAHIQNQLFTKIKNNAIGDILFKDKASSRSDIELCQLPTNHPYYIDAHQQTPSTLWARRSVIRFHSHPLLVNEIFMPAFFNDLAQVE